MRKTLIGLVAAFAAGAVLVGLPLRDRLNLVQGEAQQLKSVAEAKEAALLGHTRYLSYVTAGESALAEKMALLTASVVREQAVTQVIERVLLPGLASTGTVAIWYAVEYPFGYDLAPGQYALKAVADGLEIHVGKPRLLAPPAVSKLRYKVLSGGLLTDEKAAALALYEAAAGRAQADGSAMANDPAVIALCEKKLVQFVHDWLRQQPGVTAVPYIRVVYR